MAVQVFHFFMLRRLALPGDFGQGVRQTVGASFDEFGQFSLGGRVTNEFVLWHGMT